MTLGLLVAFAALVLVTGLHVRELPSPAGDCEVDCQRCRQALADLLGPALLAIPALLGMFWGAPLARARARERDLPPRVDAERHAPAMAPGQGRAGRRGRARRRGPRDLLVSWWFAPIDAVNGNRFDPERLRQTWDRRDRLCGLRVRARRRGGRADAPDASGDGRDAARLRRRAGRVHAVGAPAPAGEPGTAVPADVRQGASGSSGPRRAPPSTRARPRSRTRGSSRPRSSTAPTTSSAPRSMHERWSATARRSRRACRRTPAPAPQEPGRHPGRRLRNLPTRALASPGAARHLPAGGHYWPLQALETGIFLAAGSR